MILVQDSLMLWNLLTEVPPSLKSARISAIRIYLSKSPLTDLFSKSHYLCYTQSFVFSFCVNTIKQVITWYLLTSEPSYFFPHSSFMNTISLNHCGLILQFSFQGKIYFLATLKSPMLVIPMSNITDFHTFMRCTDQL